MTDLLLQGRSFCCHWECTKEMSFILQDVVSRTRVAAAVLPTVKTLLDLLCTRNSSDSAHRTISYSVRRGVLRLSNMYPTQTGLSCQGRLFGSIPLSAVPCCGCLPHPVGFAAWCYPARAGAARPPASSPTPAGIAQRLWGCRSAQHSGLANYQKHINMRRMTAWKPCVKGVLYSKTNCSWVKQMGQEKHKGGGEATPWVK